MDAEQKTSTQNLTKNPKKIGKGPMILITVLGIVILVIGIGFSGYILGYRQGEEVTQNDYESKLSEITGVIPGIIPTNQETKSISGTVKSKTDDSIVFETTKIAKSVLDIGKRVDIIAKIDSGTEIVFEKTSFDTGSDPKKPPTVNTETKKLTLGDIKEGDNLTFFCNDELYGKETFTATRVVKVDNSNIGMPLPTPEKPATPPPASTEPLEDKNQ